MKDIFFTCNTIIVVWDKKGVLTVCKAVSKTAGKGPTPLVAGLPSGIRAQKTWNTLP
jgi:hypothetical protein